ncbi:hypothetical protein COR50_15900 [Chitinophaga caeni]|uniref:DUF937 domain-containing protein n=1 Tax=Chitinophaga caeni TaxID=2029983 RepID=A0A291QX31_9BACT|nr:DUF937 domain-containing protein [Chitinophaga caeni]ATL48526.1 hypothetical protein COR50_15900 [Chitinophaga caeni]
MANDIIHSIENALGPDYSTLLATQLHESGDAVQKSIKTIVPSILAGFLYKASNATDSNTLLNIFRRADVQSSGNFGEMIKEGITPNLVSKGVDLVQSIFGSSSLALVENLARYTGIKNSSADSIINTITPITINELMQEAKGKDLNMRSILHQLNQQKEQIFNAVPKDFDLAGIIKVHNLHTVNDRFSVLATSLREHLTKPTEKPGTRWGLLLCILMGVALILWYLVRGCNPGA